MEFFFRFFSLVFRFLVFRPDEVRGSNLIISPASICCVGCLLPSFSLLGRQVSKGIVFIAQWCAAVFWLLLFFFFFVFLVKQTKEGTWLLITCICIMCMGFTPNVSFCHLISALLSGLLVHSLVVRFTNILLDWTHKFVEELLN